MCHVYKFHYPGQFIILDYYFSNKNTEFAQGEHILLAFLKMHRQANTCKKKKQTVTFPNFLKAYVLVFITILRKQ